jgi:phosphoribosylamine--glycine ligase
MNLDERGQWHDNDPSQDKNFSKTIAEPHTFGPRGESTYGVRMIGNSRRVLVVGGGGREHAIAWKLSCDKAEVFIAPGNAGTASVGTNVPIEASDIPGLVDFAGRNAIDLTVVGPEAPLVAGIVDVFAKAGHRIFGPTSAAAQIEGSKIFCKKILHRADVPTAMFQVFRTASGVREFVTSREDMPLVIKADGLAGGKGVFVCDGRRDALEAIEKLSADGQFERGRLGVLVDERLDGIEVSVMAITDGRTIVTLPPLQDHKAAYDQDKGPNTGGMGAYCPTPFLDADALAEIESRILVPTVHAMKRSKVPFHGVLFAGLMLTAQGPKVLEFNARFGDPECEAMLIRLESSLLELLDAAVDRRLEEIDPPRWKSESSVTVIMASEGYPGDVQKGLEIRGLQKAAGVPGVEVFQAATRRVNGRVENDGGRVLAVTALGASLAIAKLQAYTAVKEIRWQGAWCRKDISDKALQKERMLSEITSSDESPRVEKEGL